MDVDARSIGRPRRDVFSLDGIFTLERIYPISGEFFRGGSKAKGNDELTARNELAPLLQTLFDRDDRNEIFGYFLGRRSTVTRMYDFEPFELDYLYKTLDTTIARAYGPYGFGRATAPAKDDDLLFILMKETLESIIETNDRKVRELKSNHIEMVAPR